MPAAETKDVYGKPETVGTISNPNVTESSGMAASKCAEDLLWTHNDSGDANLIFAFDAEGTDLGTFIVDGSVNKDWEDIASFKDTEGKCHLLIGDIGDNGLRRAELTVYKIPEPEVRKNGRKPGIPDATRPAAEIRFTYPDERYDAETLMVHPVSGDIYVVTKRINGPAQVFKVGNAVAALPRNEAVKMGEVSAPTLPAGLFTGGDISSDGSRVIITDYFYGYELRLDSAGDFDRIWSAPMTRVDLGSRKQGESVCYSRDGRRLFAGSERAGSPLIAVTSKD